MTREVVATYAGAGMTPHPVMPDLIRHPYTTELRHGQNHGYRLGGRYDERGSGYQHEVRYDPTLRHAGLDPASTYH